jgi:hypothetical protein
MKKMSKVCRGMIFALALSTGVAGALAAVPAFAQGGPFQYHALTPCRVVDSRTVSATETTDGNPLQHGLHCFIVQGQCGVPSGAAAVTANFTIVGPTQAGDLRLSPNSGTEPTVSTLNYNAGEPALANGAIVPLAASAASCSTTNTTGNATGDLRARIATTGTSHLVVDVTGYFQ